MTWEPSLVSPQASTLIGTPVWKANYIDLNTFCHRRSLFLERGGFDEALRRTIDWDLILRFTKGTKVGYAPFLGCVYSDFQTQERAEFRSKSLKHSAISSRLRIETSSSDPRSAWGSPACCGCASRSRSRHPTTSGRNGVIFPFAKSLKGALERLGHKVVIDFRGRWYDRPHARDDVVIVLRGLTSYVPSTVFMNILWNISHPDQIPYEEYDAYDIIYVASLSYPAFLANVISKPVATLLQATDAWRFQPARAGSAPTTTANRILLVGNSRKRRTGRSCAGRSKDGFGRPHIRHTLE